MVSRQNNDFTARNGMGRNVKSHPFPNLNPYFACWSMNQERPYPTWQTCLWLGWLYFWVFSVSIVFAQKGPDAPARLVDWYIERCNETCYLVLHVTHDIAATPFILNDPDRIVVELPDTLVTLSPRQKRERIGEKTAPVTGWRAGAAGGMRSRLVLDLAAPYLIGQASVLVDETGWQLLFPLHPVSREVFNKTADRKHEEPHTDGEGDDIHTTGSLPPHQRDTSENRPLIIIDPGHGGIDSGARTAGGIAEKDIVFAFSQRLAQALRATNRYRVLLTRETDRFVPLEERVRFARKNQASLFISIHADSLSGHLAGTLAGQVRGLTIYTRAARASDAESAALALRENRAGSSTASVAGQNDSDVNDILEDLTLRETRSLSQKASSEVLRSLRSLGGLHPVPARQAAFHVLKAPDMPSILIELGYLSSRKDVNLLMSETWRRDTAASMVQGIDRFFTSPRTSENPREKPDKKPDKKQ
jgi:N-acetylmuramoyl-L-alanine amidase